MQPRLFCETPRPTLVSGAPVLWAPVLTTLSMPMHASEEGVTVTSAPEPLDARIQLREVQPSQLAVIRCSRYDAPFVRWFMRRNEIRLHLATDG